MADTNYADDTAQYANDRSVEEVWIQDILKPRGVSESDAMDLVSGVQAHPRLQTRLPTAIEVNKYVREAIERIPFGDLDAIEDRDEVVREMVDVLEEGVQNRRPGPASLPMSERPSTSPSGLTPADETVSEPELEKAETGSQPRASDTARQPSVGFGHPDVTDLREVLKEEASNEESGECRDSDPNGGEDE